MGFLNFDLGLFIGIINTHVTRRENQLKKCILISIWVDRDENQQETPHNSLQMSTGPITRARVKKIKMHSIG
jgi:hypothetical protein